jgi:hypothetical protein
MLLFYLGNLSFFIKSTVRGGGAASGVFFSPEIYLFSLKALCEVAALPPAGFSHQKLTFFP